MAQHESPMSSTIHPSEPEFAILFTAIRSKLLSNVRIYVYNHAAAEDIVQQTAEYVLKKLREGELRLTPKGFGRYCAKKAYWLSIDHLRQLGADRALGESELGGQDDESGIGDIPNEELDPEVVDVLDFRALLGQVSADLSVEEWAVFSLVSHGHSQKEVGKVLGKTANHVAQIRFQATLRIQEKYGATIETARRRMKDARRRHAKGL